MIGDNYVLLPSGVLAFGKGMQEGNIDERVKRWHENITNFAFFLFLLDLKLQRLRGFLLLVQLLALDVIQLLQMLNC